MKLNFPLHTLQCVLHYLINVHRIKYESENDIVIYGHIIIYLLNTKQNWDQNKPLTRSDFESKPFCQIDGNGMTPAIQVTHSCNIPERTDYQVIYAVREIADTSNSFDQAIDVDFGGTGDDANNESIWTTQLAGQLSGKDLHAGDKVIAHFFNASGEDQALQTELTIASEAKGKNSQWSYDLAQTINTAHQGKLRAGVKESDGNINPTHGVNQV